VLNPAALSVFEINHARVRFNPDPRDFRITGEIGLPFGTDYAEVSPQATLSLALAGGLQESTFVNPANVEWAPKLQVLDREGVLHASRPCPVLRRISSGVLNVVKHNQIKGVCLNFNASHRDVNAAHQVTATRTVGSTSRRVQQYAAVRPWESSRSRQRPYRSPLTWATTPGRSAHKIEGTFQRRCRTRGHDAEDPRDGTTPLARRDLRRSLRSKGASMANVGSNALRTGGRVGVAVLKPEPRSAGVVELDISMGGNRSVT
jgi:hypothetical protein